MLTPALLPAVGAGDAICDNSVVSQIPNPACAVNDAVNGAVESVGSAVDFASDPFGYLGDKLAEACPGPGGHGDPVPDRCGATGLVSGLLHQRLQDFVGPVFLPVGVRSVRELLVPGPWKASTADVAETLTIYLPAWLLGVLAGPALGQLLIGVVWSLVNDLWKWPGFGAGTNLEGTGEKLGKFVSAGPGNTIPGGDIVFIVVLTFMLLALLLVVVVLLVMSVTLYFSGALLPLSLLWIMKPGSRSKGLKVLYLWLGILFAIAIRY